MANVLSREELEAFSRKLADEEIERNPDDAERVERCHEVVLGLFDLADAEFGGDYGLVLFMAGMKLDPVGTIAAIRRSGANS